MASYAFLVKIGADVSDFNKKMEEVHNSAKNVGKGFETVGKTLTVGLTVPILGMAGAAVKSAMDFEQGMANVGAVAGATGDQMKQLSDLAMQMGKDTMYSSTEAAKGMEELIKAGVSVEDILGKNALGGALSLAAAGELELADAAEIASNALNAFKADGLSVSQAADILAGAANASATSVQELKYGLSASAAVASSVGMSFNDTATALSLFANSGLKGSDSGTSLKTMLMNLQPATKAQKAMFEKLGLVTEDGASKFYDASGKLKSLADISGLLQSSMSGLTQAQRLQAMETMFGSDAIRAANILFAAGTNGVNEMKAAMGKVTAEEVAAKKMATLKGSVEKMKGSWETAAVAIGTLMLPAIQKLAGFLEWLGNVISSMTPAQQTFILTLLGTAAAIGPILLGIAALIKITNMYAAVVANWGTIGTMLTSPFGLAVIAIIAFIAILWFLVSNWEEIKKKATDFAAWVGKVFSDGWNQVKNDTVERWGQIIKFFSDGFSRITSDTQTRWGQISKFFSDGWSRVVSDTQTRSQQVSNFFVQGWSRVVSDTQTRWNQISNFVNWALGTIQGYISYYAKYFGSLMYNAGVNMYNNFQNILWGLPNIIWNLFNRVGDMISNWRSALASRAQSVASSIWNGFKNGLGMHSPSYIEQAFMNMVTSSNAALSAIKSNVPKYQMALSSLSAPAIDITGENYGFLEGTTGPDQNNFAIDTLVVREDADIYRIAKELYRLQQTNLRSQGR